VEPWTEFESEKNDMRIIKFPDEVRNLDDMLKNYSLAELELYLFDRR